MQGYSALSNYNIAKHNCLSIDLDLIQTLEIIEKLQVITPYPEWGDQNNNKLRIFWLTVYMYFIILLYFLWGSNPKVTAVILKVTHYIPLQSPLTDGKVFVSQGTLTGYDFQSF